MGTRGGISTRALLAAAEIAEAQVLSVDIEDCSNIDLPEHLRPRWTFVRADDVAFAGQPFEDFCAAQRLPLLADVILIDTSHIYEHTRAEIAEWMPHLSPRGVMLFHDTNMSSTYRRLDGGVGRAFENDRGVIRAVEDLLARRYDETTYFTDCVNGFLVSHVPWSSGFLILRRQPASNPA